MAAGTWYHHGEQAYLHLCNLLASEALQVGQLQQVIHLHTLSTLIQVLHPSAAHGKPELRSYPSPRKWLTIQPLPCCRGKVCSLDQNGHLCSSMLAVIMAQFSRGTSSMQPVNSTLLGTVFAYEHASKATRGSFKNKGFWKDATVDRSELNRQKFNKGL